MPARTFVGPARAARLARVNLAAFVAIVLLLSCSGRTRQAGGLEVILETDMPTPATFDTLNVSLQQGVPGGGWRSLQQRDYVIPSEISLPTTIALLAGSAPDQDVLITVTGLAGNTKQPMVRRVVQTQVPTDRVAEVVVVLSSRCLGKLDCPTAGDSCQPDLGACGPGTAPPLTAYHPGDLSEAGVPTTSGSDAGATPDANREAATGTVKDSGTGTDGGMDDAIAPDGGGACAEGSRQCKSQQPQVCASGLWQDMGAPCSNLACVAGICQGVCGPQSLRCSAGGVETCDTNGAWGPPVACPAATPFCNGAGICAVCSDGSTQCSAGGGVETCVSEAWLAPVPCTNQACTMGACSGACVPNATQCSGNGVQKCDATGQWGTPAACTNQACVGGACQGACTPGDTRCLNNGAEKCGTTGAWASTQTCGAHQTCTGGGSAGAAACTCNTDATCNTTGAVCASGTTLDACAQDAQGCWYASSTSTCTNGACFGSAGSAQCCTNACTSGTTRCGGAGVQTCQVQGNGCATWNAGAACGAHQGCVTGACACNADPNCSRAGNVCVNSTTTATCSTDAQGCFYTSSTATCGANKGCQSGTCGCNAGFLACGASCVNTTSDSNNCGGCSKVCPALSSPNSGATCGNSTCRGYLGGFVSTGAGPVLFDPSSTVYAVQVRTPSAAGTFAGLGMTVGSQDPSGTTTIVILGLYADSGGAPGALLFHTNDTDASMTFANPASAFTPQSSRGVFQNGFNSALAANTTYWVYLKVAMTGVTMTLSGVSSSPCVGGTWLNNGPPDPWSVTQSSSNPACPADLQLYLIETFP